MITISDSELLLKQEYCRDNFLLLLNEVLLPDFHNDFHSVNVESNLFNEISYLGFSKKCNIGIYEIVLKSGCENRRVSITQETFKILRKMRDNNAIVSFVNCDGRNFRISLLTSKYEYDGTKIVRVLSNPRRFSYALGFETKTKTAFKFLISKGKVSDLEDLVSRFSVEVVNKQFYSQIAHSFTELIGGERNKIKYDSMLKIHNINDHNKLAEFGVRLIGRIMFCWFLQEKKSENGVPLIPTKLFTSQKINESKNYYNEVLEPLFYEILNTDIKRRKQVFTGDYFNKIPYLNGGLFNPQRDDLYEFSSITNGGKPGNVTIPNKWFLDFFAVLSEYNFTVDENTSYDIELSIDPEMLGRIFENLLAEINPETGENAKKSTGSFYTPRDVVDYMVDKSLLEYLKKETKIDEAHLKELISYSKDNSDLLLFNTDEIKNIIKALYNIRVLDPACGSGAFPIGMLQKVSYILEYLDPKAKLWLDLTTANIDPIFKKEIEKKFSSGSLNYIRKLSIIQNSIFGVDIQPIAVEISRLRCFLSLIIEEKVSDSEINRGINPLPNLDFKFLIADSLIELNNDIQMSIFEDNEHIEKLKSIRDEYFGADSERRAELKLEFKTIQQDMLINTIWNYSKQSSLRYQQLSEWKPFENVASTWFDADWMFGIKDGFDIIIANPPYIGHKGGLKEEFHKIKKTSLGKFNNERMDLFYYFYHLALNLCKKGGVVEFITTNYFVTADSAIKLRNDFKDRSDVIEIINFNEFKIFESALGQHNAICTLIRGKNKRPCQIKFVNRKGFVRSSLSGILLGTDEETDYYTIDQVDLFQGKNQYIIFRNNGAEYNDVEAGLIAKMRRFDRLSKYCNVSQGIVTGLDRIGDKHLSKLEIANIFKGDGVFVVSKDEKEKLFSKDNPYIKPWFKNSDIYKYGAKTIADQFLVYVTFDYNLGDNKEIDRHLAKFKDYIKLRNFDSGELSKAKKNNKWWPLSSARKEFDFSLPKIVVPQRCVTNKFGYTESVWYASADVYFINDKQLGNTNLKYVLGVLNSKAIYYWLYSQGKKKGNSLELYLTPLLEIPIPSANKEIKTKITNLIENIFCSHSNKELVYKYEEEIETIVNDLYGFDKKEIQLINSFACKKQNGDYE